MIDNVGYGFELTVCEVIFGIPDTNNPDLKLLIFLILGIWISVNQIKHKYTSSNSWWVNIMTYYTHGRGPGMSNFTFLKPYFLKLPHYVTIQKILQIKNNSISLS